MTKVVTLVHPNTTLQVPAPLLVSKCDLFADDAGLAAFPYPLKSQVAVSDFREFVAALEDTTLKVTNSNFRGLSQLCEEFRFRDLAGWLSQFCASEDFKNDTEAQIAIPMTEINRVGTLFADRFMFTSANAIIESSVGQAISLSPAVGEQLSVDACARTFSFRDVIAVDSIRRLLSGDKVSIIRSQSGLGQQLCSSSLELELELGWSGADRLILYSSDLAMLSVDALDEVLAGVSFSIVSEDGLLEWLLSLGDEYRPLLSRIEIRFLSATGLAILAEHFPFLPECVCCDILDRLRHLFPPSGWNSAIAADFPKLFEDFKDKQFTLLWRGSRDGFGADDFHSRCDGHPNTLTVILDTDWNIFGGFTPVKWDSDNRRKADPSLKSFLFTLVNPHNFPARKFALKAERKNKAIFCNSDRGPQFFDLYAWDNCNANTASSTSCFGNNYTNDTGLKGKAFLTGSANFQVKEIEVFEITD
jgi:hypothetical protein